MVRCGVVSRVHFSPSKNALLLNFFSRVQIEGTTTEALTTGEASTSGETGNGTAMAGVDDRNTVDTEICDRLSLSCFGCLSFAVELFIKMSSK